MKYKVGDYLAGSHTVLLKVIATLEGDPDIYALSSIKHPTDLQWFTINQMEHEEFKLAEYNPHEFDNAIAGDHIACGEGSYRKILARTGRALLLSRSADEMAKLLVGALEEAKGEGAPVPEDMLKHMKTHASNKHAGEAADDWWDIETMALMNWKLVRE